MRIAMIGTGYVGLVSGACFSEFGVDVVCVDKDADKIARLRNGQHADLRARARQAGGEQRRGRAARLHHRPQRRRCRTPMRCSSPSARRRAAATAMPISPTSSPPPRRSPRRVDRYTVVVTKSTVPVGTGRRGRAHHRARPVPTREFDVASNPEFLREGSAIGDFMRPDRVVIGAESERARDVMRQLYRPLYLIETPIVFTSIETAELIKYAANAFLATKITFINEIADLCEKVGADVQDVARGIGLDGRIGRKFLHAGPGYGGSCFPKDTLALVQDRAGLRRAAADRRDGRRRERRAQARHGRSGRSRRCGGSVAGKTIAVLGLTFKPNTDDMRDSPSLGILPRAAEGGAPRSAPSIPRAWRRRRS